MYNLECKAKLADPTNPDHYKGRIECWDYIASQGMDFFVGNIVKYVTRYKRKNGVEDLKKARTYLDKLIELEERTV